MCRKIIGKALRVLPPLLPPTGGDALHGHAPHRQPLTDLHRHVPHQLVDAPKGESALEGHSPQMSLPEEFSGSQEWGSWKYLGQWLGEKEAEDISALFVTSKVHPISSDLRGQAGVLG